MNLFQPGRPGALLSPSRTLHALPLVLLALLVTVVSFLMFRFLGVKMFAIVLAVMVFLPFLAVTSYKDMSIPMALWLLAMSGLKSLSMITMPGLPDLSPDRVLIIWVMALFLIHMLARNIRIKKPYAADVILLAHAVYILVLVLLITPGAFHSWMLSSLSPFVAYMYGKYLVRSEKEIRNLLVFILMLTVYYYITSIAEHFHWTALVWPKAILDPNQGQLFHVGRSRGPIMHPPLFGQILSMFLLVQFYFLARRGRLLWKMALIVSVLLSMLGLFFTYTRAPWVATGGALLVLALLRPGYRKIMLGLVILTAVGGLTGAFRLANSRFLQERLHSESTFENRLSFLATSLKIVRDHPFFGVGFFKSKDYLGTYNQGTYIPLFGYVKKRLGQNMVPHDIYLGRTADEGLTSTSLLLAFTILIFKSFRRQWRLNPQGKWFNRNLLALFAGIMVSYLIGGMGIDYRYFDLINVIFFLLAGIIYGFRWQPQNAALSTGGTGR